jgi:hypothetical protein
MKVKDSPLSTAIEKSLQKQERRALSPLFFKIASRFLAGVSGTLHPETAYGNTCLIRAGLFEGRMTKAFIDWVFPDDEYARRYKRLLKRELESLVVPWASAAEKAGKLIMNLSKLRSEANLEERRKLLLTMLDAVYFEVKKTKSIVAIKPKPPFKPIFQVAVNKVGSDIRIINEP